MPNVLSDSAIADSTGKYSQELYNDYEINIFPSFDQNNTYQTHK